jgi:hypothetical protein
MTHPHRAPELRPLCAPGILVSEAHPRWIHELIERVEFVRPGIFSMTVCLPTEWSKRFRADSFEIVLAEMCDQPTTDRDKGKWATIASRKA